MHLVYVQKKTYAFVMLIPKRMLTKDFCLDHQERGGRSASLAHPFQAPPRATNWDRRLLGFYHLQQAHVHHTLEEAQLSSHPLGGDRCLLSH